MIVVSFLLFLGLCYVSISIYLEMKHNKDRPKRRSRRLRANISRMLVTRTLYIQLQDKEMWDVGFGRSRDNRIFIKLIRAKYTQEGVFISEALYRYETDMPFCEDKIARINYTRQTCVGYLLENLERFKPIE